MPPPEAPSPSNEGPKSTETEEPYYSNEDVAILHDIVVLAQELLPNLPERERLPTTALFDAYYDILPRLGIDADHDSRYARVLFKIGGLRGNAGGLYEKFEEVLGRMGIEIELEHTHGEEEEEGQSRFDDSKDGLDIQGTATHGTTSPKDKTIGSKTVDSRGRPRRNSESSMWELGNQSAWKRKANRNSFSSSVDFDTQNNARPEFLEEMVRLRPPAPAPDQAIRRLDGKERNHNVGTWVESHQHRQSRRRGRSVSTVASLRIRRRSPSPRLGQLDMHQKPSYSSYIPRDELLIPSEDTAVTLATGNEDEDIEEDPTRPRLAFQVNRQSSSLIQIKASLVLQNHLGFLARSQIRQWRSRALVARDRRLHMEKAAVRHDTSVLLRSAIATWQLGALFRRRMRETTTFFAHLEERATRARNLYLMLKVLQHWLDNAQEQVQRTSFARRHIIKTRIFNAWAEMTTVNVIKAERNVQRKFFAAWKSRKAEIANQRCNAIQKYKENLVRCVYMQWIYKRWEQVAQRHWANKLKRKTLLCWVVTYHGHWDNNQIAAEERQDKLILFALRRWRDITLHQSQQDYDAVTAYRERISRNAIRKWRRETQVIPAKQMVQSDVKYRIVRETFDIWRHRTRQEMQASATDRIKILREALTTWRHQVRFQVVARKVRTRIAEEALYKWAMAQRCSWFQRRRKYKLLYSTTQTWTNRAQRAREHRWQQEDIAYAYTVQKIENTVLALWYRQMVLQQDREMVATSFSQPRLLQGVLTKWSERSRHLQQLNHWSQDAEFYFQASKTLKKWKVSAETSRREKRRLAYTQTRRTVKMGLARGILRDWREKAQNLLEMEDQAYDVRHSKIVVRGAGIFEKWRAHAGEVASMEALAREHVLKKHFTIWKQRSGAYQALEKEAILTYQEHRQSRAIKKWNLAILQLGAQTNYAYDIREKNAKRTFRKMFAYWRHKAAQKRPPKVVESKGDNEHLGITARAEAWSEYGDGGGDEWMKEFDEVDAVMATPIPGYLSTPSKRSERVMAVAARFSTTPKIPLSTPFERQLRAQYSGGQLHSFRKGRLGKSTLSMGGFEDIPERSHNE